MDTALLYGSILVMLIALLLSLIPFMPGPLLLWGIAITVAAVDGFEHVTPLAMVIMTLLMILGFTSDFWLTAIGMQSKGNSCWASFGSVVGGILGTGLIPIVGTLIGAIVGALVVEFMRLGDIREATKAGKSAMEMIVLGIAVEFAFGVAIFTVFVASILLTT